MHSAHSTHRDWLGSEAKNTLSHSRISAHSGQYLKKEKMGENEKEEKQEDRQQSIHWQITWLLAALKTDTYRRRRKKKKNQTRTLLTSEKWERKNVQCSHLFPFFFSFLSPIQIHLPLCFLHFHSSLLLSLSLPSFFTSFLCLFFFLYFLHFFFTSLTSSPVQWRWRRRQRQRQRQRQPRRMMGQTTKRRRKRRGTFHGETNRLPLVKCCCCFPADRPTLSLSLSHLVLLSTSPTSPSPPLLFF